MPSFLSKKQIKKLKQGQEAAFRSPIPTQMVSNGEFVPLPQSKEQRQVEGRIKEMADEFGKPHGLNRRQFLGTAAGMATAFLAMNEVFGTVFNVNRAEAAEHGAADERAKALASQFIFDDQTHLVHDGFAQEGYWGWGSLPLKTGTLPSPRNN